MVKFFDFLGSLVIRFIEESGRIMLLFIKTLMWIFRPPLNLKNIVRQMEEVGVNSIPVVLIMSIFTGMVLALQSYTAFRRFNAEAFIGTVVALSMVRELGPVLSGLMVSGRVGAAMAAELGTMQVTEQIDALYALATNPIKFLIVPRFLAALFVMPVLVILADIIGIIGGYLVSVILLGTNSTIYIKRTWDYMELEDIYTGLLKACIFGIIIATISCYQGFSTRGGAEGVGKATTRAVVLSSLIILISNYFIAALMF
ncbi:MAG: ABC transporter permease [Deltaproteobacteria bacterium CG12_big_fil_rev_8_21_14_0_65_43_10]|nr:MAG: ABC transporter permease [Deltaproteobacteria bacterium CG2_30_43_15]PIQ46423.1 MAG: ABC transporter permease [Deltaproteobacteria bacterium CG12_big_fil_rev_8_21_14_0_65_43_10]PIU84826.1 MAG: ABC transporter permease [Deltaproteobacteria bacterium CG06_land_8_20_14_3_00_44_19]PIX22593.1 MAG: ABC transporter permease [Deltaproteobacteria bacterium CG_4_8_14_3_um_filter_43_13]PIZ18909.1 MAG: ABC transporter permease [Deltaproteobacteria bacterium CG_4_10_14_0_8_um_filter_43_12]PJB46161.